MIPTQSKQLVNKELHQFRAQYEKSSLSRSDLHIDPFEQFKSYLQIAVEEKVVEPNAMALSSISKDGFPNTRIVLLKEIEANALVFYTNYTSQKAIEIAHEPKVSAVFLWKEMQTQVRISGFAEKVSREQSNNYFATRPRKSQLGAWASDQSSNIESREALEAKMEEMEEKFKAQENIPAPDHWGGYRIIISTFEFWQGRRSRLHDRFRYTQINEKWKIERLAP